LFHHFSIHLYGKIRSKFHRHFFGLGQAKAILNMLIFFFEIAILEIPLSSRIIISQTN